MEKSLRILWGVALACLLFGCFYGLGAYPLMDNNEGLYASIARNMSQGGNIVIPQLNGMPYIEKPPLFYWLAAFSMYLFGDSEWAARLVPALSLFGVITACALFMARKADKQAAAIAVMILSSSVVLLAVGRMMYFDMLFTCFVTLALLSAYEWFETRRRVWLIFTYTLVALGMMTKGLLAIVLVAGTGFWFLLAEGQLRARWKGFFDWLGILVFLLIVVPWHVQAAMSDPGFAWFYFINEHVLRFLNMREPHDYYSGPFWYYLPRLFVYLFPWSVCLPLMLLRKDMKPADRLERFLWCWLLWPLLFFSLSTAKANYYMIVGVPALAMLLARRLSLLLETAKPRVRLELMAVACTIFVVLPACIYLTLASGGLLSQRNLVDYLELHHPEEPTALYRDFEEFSAIPYYLDDKIMIIDSDSKDLLYGKKRVGNDHRIFATLGDWLQWSSESPTPTRLLLNKLYIHSLEKRMGRLPVSAKLDMQVQEFTRIAVVTLSAKNLKSDGK